MELNVLQDPRPLELPRSELLKLAAVDSVFYCRTFFPKTFRQKSPEFHRDFWRKFDDPNYDLFGAEMFRGAGKTTLTRAGVSKRIAYGICRNALVVAISMDMAIHTIRWLKKQVEQNSFWAQTFMLSKGTKWTDDWIEIVNGSSDCTINVVAKGMTSGLRGLNPDDWRPDFIFCDDISNEETVGTEEQRIKARELFFGALVPTLAPKSEAPMRKLVLAQTSLHKEDIISLAHKDPAFRTVKYPKLIERDQLPPVSAWPERFSTEEVLKEKEDYTKRGQIHVWLREYGCKIVSRETAPLQSSWLKYWTVLPTDLEFYLGLDPATDSEHKKVHKSAMAIVGVHRKTGNTYLIEYYSQKSKNPDELWEWFVRAVRQYHPRKQGVETIAFQKMLKWYFQKKMQESSMFFVIEEIKDRRSKAQRIIDAFGIAPHGKFFVNENHTEFIQGWTEWTEEQDWDLGDAVSMAIGLANPWMTHSYMEAEDIGMTLEDERDIPELVFEGGCP